MSHLSGNLKEQKTCLKHSQKFPLFPYFSPLWLSIHPGGEECFEVDRHSGEIRTTGRPLAPSKEYQLRVQAMDGHGRKGSPAIVAILAGYRPPQFTNSTYSLNVPENKPVGQAWVTAAEWKPELHYHHLSGILFMAPHDFCPMPVFNTKEICCKGTNQHWHHHLHSFSLKKTYYTHF